MIRAAVRRSYSSKGGERRRGAGDEKRGVVNVRMRGVVKEEGGGGRRLANDSPLPTEEVGKRKVEQVKGDEEGNVGKKK